MNLAGILRLDWLAGTCITLLFLLAYQNNIHVTQDLENKLYDLTISAPQVPADSNIIILHPDQQTAASPVQASQASLATLINALSDANAALIGMEMLPAQTNHKPAAALLEAIRRSGNTVMPVYFDTSASNAPSHPDPGDDLPLLSIQHVQDLQQQTTPVQMQNPRFPSPPWMQVAAGLGYITVLADADGTVRSEPLVAQTGKHYVPSMPLALAAKVLRIPLHDIRLHSGVDIELGAQNIAIDSRLGIFPTLYHNPVGSTFPTYSFDDVVSKHIPAATLKNKVILLAAAGNLAATTLQIPQHGQISRMEFIADSLQSILKHQYISRPAWAHQLEWMLLVLIGLYLIVLLPRLNRNIAMVTSSILLAALLAGSITLLTQGLWLHTLLAAGMLLSGHILFEAAKHIPVANRKKENAQSMAETNLMLGLSFQHQGMLDQALEKFLVCPLDDEMCGILYDLAQAFERKRQFKQAISAYEHITYQHAGYKDASARLIQAKSSEASLSDKDASAALSSLLLSGDKHPTLGRYEIISELGKGAMGTVYLGKDPKINRQVAIKTMPLSQEFAPDELEEVKTRFFHEAEIAGMLNHPNIVTIYDAGDEHDLAYIAMEYLDGIDLSPYTKKGKLLPITTTLKILAKVAEALQYAHAHDVIHRDIKPANIMILKNKSVKVTDFGIAHINDSSKTKAGTVLGTPSYMSPEQLSGKILDGRSDLFSLGVMLYELACGVRPFRASSISKLMFKIAKEPHVDVRQHNPDVPDCVHTLIDSLLTKKADLRLESASEMLTAISACLREIKHQGGKST